MWELSEKYEVGVWYERDFCGVVVNGVRLGNPYCRTAEECVERILEDYRREVERMKEPPPPPPPDPVEELLKEWPELEAFGIEWLRFWAPHMRERIAGIAKILRRYPWTAKVVGLLTRQTHVLISPYIVTAYVARDGSEACISLGSRGTYCSADGGATVRRLELEFSRLEPHEGVIREVYRPKAKGLLAFAAEAKEYVRIL